MRALVTGPNGFIGRHLVGRLLEDGWDVIGLARPAVDLADPESTAAAARTAEVDVAFLLAAARAEATPAERAATLSVNATSVLWLLDALPARCRTVVRLGSSTEYAAAAGPMDEETPLRPRGYFGATKAAGGLLLEAAGAATGRRVVNLRAFQVYGPGDHAHRLVPAALRAARTGARLPLTAPGRRRDWVYVDDVVEACVRAAQADHLPAAPALNIGTGRQWSNEELVALVERVTGRPLAVDAGAHPGAPWDTASWVCDPSRARDLLGREAKVGLEEGLRRCWEEDRGVTVAVVTPVYGNESTLAEIATRVAAALDGRDPPWRLRFVIDASPDGSLAVVEALAAADAGGRIAVTSLAVNGGQNQALIRGLAAEPDATIWVCLDADLQDPPEAIPALLERLAGGDVDAVFAGRRGDYESRGRLLTGALYRAALSRLAGLPRDAGAFVALSPAARHALVTLNPPSLVAGVGAARLRSVSVPVERAARPAGQSAWTSAARARQSARTLTWVAGQRLHRWTTTSA